MISRKLFSILFALSLFLGGSTLSASCISDCEASGAGITAATGCQACGDAHTETCIQFECIAM